MKQELITPRKAVELVLEKCSTGAGEEVGLADALGRVLHVDAVADYSLPGFDNSAMDGFAIRAADLRAASEHSPATLAVVGESRAGRPCDRRMGAGEAVAISTGAEIPQGADAVAEIEIVAQDDASGSECIRIATGVASGRGIRPRGEDVEAGQTVLVGGTRLGGAELAVAASVGIDPVCVTERPRLATITTGDELRAPGAELPPGAVHDSNIVSIPALARECGADPTLSMRAVDDRGQTEAALAKAIGSADIVVICGGVSVGQHDHVKAALRGLGVTEIFWGVSLKPGKPTWFGTASDGTLVFGLPGNPVSAMVTFQLFVARAIRAVQGAEPEPPKLIAHLAGEHKANPRRSEYLRCTLESEGASLVARPTQANQSSHVLGSMIGAWALAHLPPSDGPTHDGMPVEVELLPGPLPVI